MILGQGRQAAVIYPGGWYTKGSKGNGTKRPDDVGGFLNRHFFLNGDESGSSRGMFLCQAARHTRLATATYRRQRHVRVPRRFALTGTTPGGGGRTVATSAPVVAFVHRRPVGARGKRDTFFQP